MKRLSKMATLVLCYSLFTGCAVSTKPLVQEDVLKRITVDRDAMYKNQEPVTTAVTLEEAMARSIKYNLDHRLKIMEDALALRQVNLMTFDMLPRLVAAAGYTERDSYNASSSMNVFTKQQSLAPSTSQDLGHYNGDLTLTWNILDFGVSYLQAKQQADRAHIMQERRRKVLHSIMQQVRQAYWLALGAQQLEGRFDPMLKEVEKALQDSSSIEQEKLRPPIETLTYRKTLLEIMKQLEVFRDELAQAKPRLASLMNLPLGESFSLNPSKLEMLELTGKLEEMEQRALLQRPELREADYNDRISVNETRKAILRMLPGMEMTVGGHFDSTSFLVSQKWVEGGARLTWNLLNLISGPSQYKIATSQVEIAEAQRLALSMAILTQVHVAYQDFYNRKRQYALSEQLQDVDARIYEQTMNQAASGSQNRLNQIRSATAALMAEYRSYQNYAALQSACGQIIATLGEDPLPETVTSHEIKALSSEIGARLYAPGALCVPVATPPAPMITPPAPAAQPAPKPEIKPIPVAPAPTLTFSIIPGAISKGNSARLSWAASHATTCDIQPGVGVVMPQGEMNVTPAETTTYVIICDGPGGSTTESSNLVVTQPVMEPAPPQVSSAKLCSPAILSLEFDNARSALKWEHRPELKKLVRFLKEFPEATGEISGHTDNTPIHVQNITNKMLSQRRADNIRSYLIKRGIDPQRITAKGFGAGKPVADNSTESGRQKNRRIETNFRCK